MSLQNLFQVWKPQNVKMVLFSDYARDVLTLLLALIVLRFLVMLL